VAEHGDRSLLVRMLLAALEQLERRTQLERPARRS
jgi:hypothetical protein